ncbi:uncharacterized protein [Anomalospiza imberbis]|uniref:uncharacterized protein n=1 Tax=Anomalospiza imberbis TaxID=187417 RepID=UPI00358DDE4F
MSKRQEANAHCQSHVGQPLLSKRRQVPQRLPQEAAEVTWVTIKPLQWDRPIPRQNNSWRPTGLGRQEGSLEDGHSLPRSGTVTRPPRLSVSDLLPLHGPPLTVTCPWQLSPEMPRAASARIKMPPLPAAPEASGRRARAQSRGPIASHYRELVPPSPWGTMATDRAQETPSPDSSAGGLWRGSAVRQGHCLPPLRHAGGVLLCTGTQTAWNHLGHTEMEDPTEVQEEHSGKTAGCMFRGLAPCLREDTSVKSTCTQEYSSLCQEADAEPQVLPSTPSLPKGSTGEMGNSSELMSPGLIAEPCSGSDNSWPEESSLKEPEEKWEEEGLPDPEATGDRDSDSQSMSLAPLKVKKAEAAASALAGDAWDDGPSELFPTSEPEETSGFSASSSPRGTCEERGTRVPAEQSAHSKLLCMETEDALKPLLHIKAEELEQLEEDILCSLDQGSPSVPHSLCIWSKGCAGEAENYSQLVPSDLFAELWSLFNNRDVPCWDTHVD